jgi:hypothetical protein
MDKKLRLYSVDGDENAKVASYFFKKFPIMGASFTPAGHPRERVPLGWVDLGAEDPNHPVLRTSRSMQHPADKWISWSNHLM